MTVETPFVTCTLDDVGRRTLVTAQLLGAPVYAGGKPVLVELLLETGRYTLGPFATTGALNEAAKLLLAERPPTVKA